MSYNLMLVENDTVLLKAIEQYLQDQKFNVYTANNGLEAFELANKFKFDLIISDIMMPVLDGYQLLEKMQQIDKFTPPPIIFLTAKGMTKDRIKGYNMGCHGYLSKPFDPEELVSLIKNLISRDSLNDQYIKKDNTIETSSVDKIHFTPREKSILNLVIDGLTNKEIATILDTSIRNVEKYVSRLLNKTRMKNRTLLVKYSIHNNLLNKIEGE